MADETRIIQVNTGTTAQWNNQVRALKVGEFGFDKDTKEVKIGDGASSFANLEPLLTSSKLPAATNTDLGAVKLATATVQTVTPQSPTAVAGRTYGVQKNGSGQLTVNVPWTDTNTTYGVATASANGLMSAADKAKLDDPDTGKFFVGELYFQLVIRAGFVWANGQTLTNVSTKYPKLAAWLKDTGTYGGAWLRKSLAEWNTVWNLPGWNEPTTGALANRAGMCQFYVLDESANTIKVPDLRGAFQGAAGFVGLENGSVYADTMRNIVGRINIWSRHIHSVNGAFYIPGDDDTGKVSHAQNEISGTVGHTSAIFDASRCVLTGDALYPRCVAERLCLYAGGAA